MGKDIAHRRGNEHLSHLSSEFARTITDGEYTTIEIAVMACSNIYFNIVYIVSSQNCHRCQENQLSTIVLSPSERSLL